MSGKTIAFGVPALMHVRKKLSEKCAKKGLPRCLMLAPTRELAQQVNLYRMFIVLVIFNVWVDAIHLLWQ